MELSSIKLVFNRLLSHDSYGDKSPRSVPARVLAVIWVMMSAVFLSLFTANATSILNQSLQEEDYTETIGKKV